MKKKIPILFILSFLFIPHTVYASLLCDYSEKVRLKNFAANINKSYDYVELEDKAIFKITLSNVYKELYLLDKKSEEGVTFRPNTNQDMSEIVLENYESGKSYQFDIYTTHEYCEEDVIETIYITLPTYNPYYKLPVCVGLESYELCTKWSNHGLSKEKFIETVMNYKQEKEEEEEKEEERRTSYLLEFYLKYYYILLPAVILGVVAWIYKMNKKDQFF